jgi:hypothetical protein
LYNELVKRTKKEKQDMRSMLYYVCDILRLDRIIFYDNGGLVLDDLDAEAIINVFGYVLYSTLAKEFDKEGLSKMRMLVKKTEFHEFCVKITKGDDKELYEKFVKWYTGLTDEELKNLENKSKWINQLFFVELNNVFNRWYKRKPKFSELDGELQKYLLINHEEDKALINNPNTQQAIKRYCKKLTKYEIF